MDMRLKCEKPGDIIYTVTMTMKASDWERFREQLQNQWPSSDLQYQIDDLLGQARKIYWPATKAVAD